MPRGFRAKRGVGARGVRGLRLLEGFLEKVQKDFPQRNHFEGLVSTRVLGFRLESRGLSNPKKILGDNIVKMRQPLLLFIPTSIVYAP